MTAAPPCFPAPARPSKRAATLPISCAASRSSPAWTPIPSASPTGFSPGFRSGSNGKWSSPPAPRSRPGVWPRWTWKATFRPAPIRTRSAAAARCTPARRARLAAAIEEWLTAENERDRHNQGEVDDSTAQALQRIADGIGYLDILSASLEGTARPPARPARRRLWTAPPARARRLHRQTNACRPAAAPADRRAEADPRPRHRRLWPHPRFAGRHAAPARARRDGQALWPCARGSSARRAGCSA